MKKCIVLIFCFCLLISCSTEQSQNVLIDGVVITNSFERAKTLSELMGKNYKITRLQTIEKSFIGRVGKIKKNRNHYYVLTDDKKIIRFDEDGKFVSVLNRLGNGPDEYAYISDFEVVNLRGKSEIWLCDMNKIIVYDADNCNYLKTVDYDFVINKFRVINQNRILLLTGQNKKSLSLSDSQGNILQTYLDKEIPFLGFKSLQFIPFNSKLLFHLGISDSFVSYDSITDSFSKGVFFSSSYFIKEQELLSLFQELGQDYLFKMKDYNYIRNFRQLKDKVFLDLWLKEKRVLISVNKDRKILSDDFLPEKSSLKNDLFGLNVSTFFLTIGIGDSGDSVLMYATADDINSDENCVNNEIFKNLEEDDNPCLIEFF